MHKNNAVLTRTISKFNLKNNDKCREGKIKHHPSVTMG